MTLKRYDWERLNVSHSEVMAVVVDRFQGHRSVARCGHRSVARCTDTQDAQLIIDALNKWEDTKDGRD